MDYSEKVEYLKSYRDKCDRVTFIDNQMMGVKAINYGPALGGHKSLGQYMAEKQGLLNEMEAIENSINGVEDIKARSVLGYKYLQFKTFQEIADKLGYSKSTIRDVHRKGIDQLKI